MSSAQQGPLQKAKIKRGEQVQVIAGKAKGQIGEVLRVDLKRNRVFVKDVNMQMRHQKPRGQNDQGGIMSVEGPLHLSNVLKYCPSCERGVRKLCTATADCRYYQQRQKS